MLKRKAIKRFYLTTLVLFIMLTTFTLNHFQDDKVINLQEIEYVSNFETSHIYLLNMDNYLVKVDILLEKDSIENMASKVLNELSVTNTKYNDLKGLIPSNTKIYNLEFNDDTLIVNFSSDLLKVNKNIEEKVIESIVYSLLEIKDIKNVHIKIDGEDLTRLEKNNKIIPTILNETIGINKDYEIKNLHEIQKVVIYYVFKNQDNEYYVPVTKYLNSKDNKVKIIIDSLKESHSSNTNLISYLNKKMHINFQIDNDILTFTFQDLNESNLESIIYSLTSSVFDSMDIQKVFFEVNNKIIDMRIKS